MDPYQTAQRALADLKAAVLAYLRSCPVPQRNADVGRALGIYGGHIGHEGHVSRTILNLLQEEGLIRQDGDKGPWKAL